MSQSFDVHFFRTMARFEIIKKKFSSLTFTLHRKKKKEETLQRLNEFECHYKREDLFLIEFAHLK